VTARYDLLAPVLRSISYADWCTEKGQKPKEDVKGTVTDVIASTPDRDRVGDIVDQTWQLDSFKGNPIALWNHDASLGPVGRVVDIGLKDGNLVASILWDESPENPLGRRVAAQFRNGFLNAVSVGFRPHKVFSKVQLQEMDDDRADDLDDYGMLLTDNELLEISAVSIPANAQALTRAMPEEEDGEDTFAKAVLDVIEGAFRGNQQFRRMVLIALNLTEPTVRSAPQAKTPEPQPEPDPFAEWTKALAGKPNTFEDWFNESA